MCLVFNLSTLNLSDLGLTDEISAYVKKNNLSDFALGRVTQEHRERYIVSTGENEFDAEITGNLRFSANSRADFPSVGDWVIMTVYDLDLAIIHKILPRKSVLERQAVGKFGEKQIISTNIDVAFIIQSIDNNFSINRLERYLTICYSANIEPVLVISKIDLSTEIDIRNASKKLEIRDKKVKYILLSNLTQQGLDQILEVLQKGKNPDFYFYKYPILDERFVESGTMTGQYFHQDLYVARRIFNENPKSHVDIGSQTNGFVAHVASLRGISFHWKWQLIRNGRVSPFGPIRFCFRISHLYLSCFPALF